eukprot:Opistho-2@60249
MVDDEKNSFCIGWSNKGQNFLVINAERFSKDVLPLYFKHNNFASFIRQLNMYGFSKVTSVRKGMVQGPPHAWEFSHQYFRKGHPDLLCHINRKTYSGSAPASAASPAPTPAPAMGSSPVSGEAKTARTSTAPTIKKEPSSLFAVPAALQQPAMPQAQAQAQAQARVQSDDRSDVAMSTADPSEMQRELEEMRHQQVELQGVIDE